VISSTPLALFGGVAEGEKKADVVEYPEVLDHVGLLVSEPPGTAGLPFT
jgi:hypothetical protein